jgi:hypothetical protein
MHRESQGNAHKHRKNKTINHTNNNFHNISLLWIREIYSRLGNMDNARTGSGGQTAAYN